MNTLLRRRSMIAAGGGSPTPPGPEPVQHTITLYPSSYVSDDKQYASFNGVANGYGNTSSTSYAQMNLTTGAGAESWFYYKFDTSSIPADAIINSVSCSSKNYISSTDSSIATPRQWQLFSGTTPKGSSQGLRASVGVNSVGSGGEWTREELQDCRLRLYAKRGDTSTSTTVSIRFYGANLTITYSVYEDNEQSE